MFRPVRLARPEDPEALQQQGLNQRSPAEGKGKRQKLLAQGIALGIIAISNAPCKGKSFMYYPAVLKLLPLTGRIG